MISTELFKVWVREHQDLKKVPNSDLKSFRIFGCFGLSTILFGVYISISVQLIEN